MLSRGEPCEALSPVQSPLTPLTHSFCELPAIWRLHSRQRSWPTSKRTRMTPACRRFIGSTVCRLQQLPSVPPCGSLQSGTDGTESHWTTTSSSVQLYEHQSALRQQRLTIENSYASSDSARPDWAWVRVHTTTCSGPANTTRPSPRNGQTCQCRLGI